ncbi:MAG: acylneuraminate cytidylyltransferase family protein [Lachnospiraceae bacterium]|nr:acylneuraminate cytidylyltransferase family protein [Lachnospiraceae bacterium]
MKAIAIIPARSGSKGLPNKNILPLEGKPMMAYTIEACLESGCFQRVHVSTDSEEYAQIAIEYGADVPFLRDPLLATDQATTEDVIWDVLEKYHALGEEFEVFGIMQPTSPLRNAIDIQNSFQLFQEKNANSIIGVCPMEHSPLWSNQLGEADSMYHFLNVQTNQNRQQFGQYYRINGAIYLMRISEYSSHMALYGEKSYAYRMPKERSIDIDDEMDLEIAKVFMKFKNR